MRVSVCVCNSAGGARTHVNRRTSANAPTKSGAPHHSSSSLPPSPSPRRARARARARARLGTNKPKPIESVEVSGNDAVFPPAVVARSILAGAARGEWVVANPRLDVHLLQDLTLGLVPRTWLRLPWVMLRCFLGPVICWAIAAHFDAIARRHAAQRYARFWGGSSGGDGGGGGEAAAGNGGAAGADGGKKGKAVAAAASSARPKRA